MIGTVVQLRGIVQQSSKTLVIGATSQTRQQFLPRSQVLCREENDTHPSRLPDLSRRRTYRCTRFLAEEQRSEAEYCREAHLATTVTSIEVETNVEENWN